MKTRILFALTLACLTHVAFGQIKIGDNPQTLDAGSVLELESTNRALVITRLSNDAMNNLTPLPGALVYNLDLECVHYYNGTNWINLCDASAVELTNDPIVNAYRSIALTPVGNQINIEVDSITGLNIVDRTITRDDYQLASVGGNIIQDRSVTPIKLQPGTPNQYLRTDAAGTDAVWADPEIVAMGKADGSNLLGGRGATVLPVTPGVHNVILDTPRNGSDYIIQLTVEGNNRIYVSEGTQTPNSFVVTIFDLGLGVPADNVWYFTVLDY